MKVGGAYIAFSLLVSQILDFCRHVLDLGDVIVATSTFD
jgi:hypothetical protein